MSALESAKSYVTFQQLGGISVTVDEVIAEIKQWPMDGVLGFLGELSLEAVQNSSEFFDPRNQGEYLNLAIVDDFPKKLPMAFKMYAPGRVPFTGNRHLFIHEHNIAWLSHMTILYAKEGAFTPELSLKLRRRVCRLLLIANDFFSGNNSQPHGNLMQRKSFILKWLRHYQFNQFFRGIWSSMIKLARQWVILVDLLPNFFDVDSAFIKATDGITLQRYFEILALFLSHVHFGMTLENKRLSRETLCSEILSGRNEIEHFIKRWSITPCQYRSEFEKWRCSRSSDGYLPHFDFVPLRKSPLIEARPGELICPIMPFFLAKIVDEPYFIISECLEGYGNFQTALGLAYEKYAQGLVDRIAKGDIKEQWFFIHNPPNNPKEEFSDSYLQRGDIAFAFEHKGLRQGTDFLRGGETNRVIGPSDEILSKLDNLEPVELKRGRNEDKGLLTHGMWQQSINGALFCSWLEQKMGVQPKKIFPIITYLSELKVDEILRVAYLNLLIDRANLYSDKCWEHPEWIHVSDLEALAELADHGYLDLEGLIKEKAVQYAKSSFGDFLYYRFDKKIIIDSKLMDTVSRLIRQGTKYFFIRDIVIESVR